jgi:2-polyprenyl-3-methyl-5-hydroxy-6-metoxy-1,4-benzoquinol methylase
MIDETTRACPICETSMEPAGTRRSEWSGRTFALVQCPLCQFAAVTEPRTDFEVLYDAEYYAGRGADPLVDFAGEMEDAATIRRHEWEGIEQVVSGLTGRGQEVRWLDYGCGLGGLVRHLRERGYDQAYGFDEGFGARYMEAHGIPHLAAADLATARGCFDVVTCIEVIEHIADPMSALREVSRLLAPGGVLFLTTGNARPHRGKLDRWSYVRPDIHVSFFEPTTLERAFGVVGLAAERPGLVPGMEQIIRYKVMKTMRLGRARSVTDVVPWRTVARLVDRRHGVSHHPVGRKAIAPVS